MKVDYVQYSAKMLVLTSFLTLKFIFVGVCDNRRFNNVEYRMEFDINNDRKIGGNDTQLKQFS